MRERAGLSVLNLGAPMDVLWFRLSRKSSDSGDPIGRFDAGRIFIMNKGILQQSGAPMDVYSNPASRFVAGFTGFGQISATLSLLTFIAAPAVPGAAEAVKQE